MEIMEADSVRKYSLRIDAATGEIIGNYSHKDTDPGVELDRLIRRYMAGHNVDYGAAFREICADPANTKIVKAHELCKGCERQ